MNKKKELFIGWKDEMPAGNKSLLRKVLIPLFILLPIIVILLVLAQRPFNNHIFEFGNVKNISGTYYQSPFPILIADQKDLPEGLSNEILLVGYGKFGAKGIMDQIQDKNGPLVGKTITLSGTLIYGDQKTLLELSPTSTLVNVDNQNTSPTPPIPTVNPISVNGEIVDPKCYFGVMKPGEGKIHKSCAIRCISGGIPPVFRHQTNDQTTPYQYFLMVDDQGKAINKAILPFVGEQVSLQAKASTFGSWDILYLNPEDIKYQ